MCCGRAARRAGRVSLSSLHFGNVVQQRQRLRRRSDFAATYQSGRSWASPLLILRARRTGGPDTRFGFAVGRRIGNAVVRNRLKRRLREIVRRLPASPGWDVVIIARKPAAESDFADLALALARLFKRAGLQGQDQGKTE